jgi:Phosphoenolpyruvate synthase/pyruvate phosphate dikinase
VPPAIAWVDEVAPDEAISVCGAKMGRLAELLRAGVSLPKGFTVTVEAFRRHWDQAAWTRWPTQRWAGSAPMPGPPRSKRPPAPSGPNWPAGTSAPTWPR